MALALGPWHWDLGIGLGIGLNRHDTHYVRFDRTTMRPLHRLPSHEGARRGPVPAPLLPLPGRAVRRHLRAAVAGAVLLCLAAAGLVAGGALTGPAERFAEDTLRRMVPETLALDLGGTDIRLAWPPGLAVGFDDAVLTPVGGGDAAASAGRLVVRIDPLSLLSGEPRIAGASVDGAFVDLPALRAAISPQAASDPFSLNGLPERFDRFFAVLRDWGGVHLHRRGDLALSVTESRFALEAGPAAWPFEVVSLTARADGAGTARLTGTVGLDGLVGPVAAELTVPPPAMPEGAARLVVEADAVPFPWRRLPTLFSSEMADHAPGLVRAPLPGRARLELVHAGADPRRNALRLSLTPQDLSLKLAPDDFVPVTAPLTFDYGFDDRIVTLEPARWSVGRSTLELSGRFRDAIGAVAPQGAPAVPVEFDVIANRGRLAPADSPVEQLRFAARARGTFDAAERLVRFTGMEMQSDAGGATAEGQVSFEPIAPSAVFRIDVDDMTVAGLKQFWPTPVARAARRWVLENLAGGRVLAGRFDIAEPLRRRAPETGARIAGDSRITLDVEGVRFDIAGDLPPVRDAIGRVELADGTVRMTLRSGTVYLQSGRTAEAREGVMVIGPGDADGIVTGDVNVRLTGSAAALGEIIAHRPIDARRYRAYDPADLSGQVDARIAASLALNGGARAPAPDWRVEMTLTDAAIAEPVEGRRVAGLDGRVSATPAGAVLDLSGTIDGLPADIAMTVPFGGSELAPARDITLRLDDESRRALAPGLEAVLRGPTPVRLEGDGPAFEVAADLTAAELALPWIGWSKGVGVEASATFALVLEEGAATVDDLTVSGGPFAARGSLAVDGGGLRRARFGALRLNPGDEVAVDIDRDGAGYAIAVEGASFDARALIRHVRKQMGAATGGNGDAVPVTVSAALGTVGGFGGERMRDVRAELALREGALQSLSITGTGASGMPFSLAVDGRGADRRVRIEAFDAGEFLRFADLYGQVRGGILRIALAGAEGGRLTGPARLTDFRVFDEPRLAQLVSSRFDGADSLREAVGRDIDTSEVAFDLAQGVATLSPEGLALGEGIVRGPLVGFALRGEVRDRQGRMRMTGTFMPAYGLNSLFADIPILGLVLGNGRDRGLIGVTFKLEGPSDSPQVTVNPLSVIAPGVFRSIFEFR